MEKLNKVKEHIAQIKAKIADPHLCEGTASTYTRISGYFRPVENFNEGKAQEYKERKEYKI